MYTVGDDKKLAGIVQCRFKIPEDTQINVTISGTTDNFQMKDDFAVPEDQIEYSADMEPDTFVEEKETKVEYKTSNPQV